MAHLFKRNRIYYLKYYLGGKQKEVSLRTDVLQIAKERAVQIDRHPNSEHIRTPLTGDIRTSITCALTGLGIGASQWPSRPHGIPMMSVRCG